MRFAAVYVSNFMVQAVLRAEPDLRGRALALADGTPPLCKIVAADEAALLAGIALGMGEAQAAQFCRVAIRRRSPAFEKAAHAALLDLGWSVSPRIEDAAPDTIVLDLTGLSSLFGPEENIAAELLKRAAGLGLVARIAIASGVETALHAARGSSGITVIHEGEESKYMGGLPVRALDPFAEILEILERWGVRTCAALAALPVLQLSERLGHEGVRLHELARGASIRSLRLAQPETCFEEEMALDYAVAELEPLSFLLGRLLDQLCARLEARALAASAIRVRFDLERSAETESQPVGKNPAPPAASLTYENILSLPVPMRDSKMLLKLLRLRLQAEPPRASVVKIALAADPSAPRVAQGGLFLAAAPDPEKLEVTVAKIASVVGNSNVGSPQLIDTHRPGEFWMSRFAPASFAPALGESKSRKPFESSFESRFGRTITGFRIFRPALPAQVELRERCPWRIRFRGLNGEVVAASGPWRTSGDWWLAEAWQQDEWDVELRFDNVRDDGKSNMEGGKPSLGKDSSPARSDRESRRTQDGIYRVYFDGLRQSWFVRGRYD